MVPCLLDMPDIAMVKVLGKLDYISIQCLGKTCHDFRNFIDEVKPECNISKVDVRIEAEMIFSSLQIDGRGFGIDYRKRGKGCAVSWLKSGQTKEKFFENSDFVAVACRDLEIMLNHKKSPLELFTVDLRKQTENELAQLTHSKFLSQFRGILQDKTPFVKTNTFLTSIENDEQLLELLPFVDPESLEKLMVHNMNETGTDLKMDEILKLKQWKSVKELTLIDFYIEISKENLSHFKRVAIDAETASMKTISKWKEIFLTSPKLEYLEIRFKTCSEAEQVVESFGEPYNVVLQKSGKIITWFVSYPDSDQVYAVTTSSKIIIFGDVKTSSVPDGAVINKL